MHTSDSADGDPRVVTAARPGGSASAGATHPADAAGGEPRLVTAARRGLAIAAGVAVVALVGFAAASGNPVATTPYVAGRVRGRPNPVDTQLPTAAPRQEDGPPGWLLWLLDGFLWLCALAIVVMLVVLAVRLFVGPQSGLIRRRVLEPDEVAALAAPRIDIDMLGRGRDLSDAVAAGIEALAEGSDVRSGIIAAWLRLEDAAAEAGTPRRDDDAPGDLVSRMLGAHDIRPRRLQTLAELYRRARFSPAPLDERDRDEAHRALADVRADLASGVPDARLEWSPRLSGIPSGERRPTRWT